MSIFPKTLDRGAALAYFLGGIVPLVALGIVVDRYALLPLGAALIESYSTLGLIGLVTSVSLLSLGSFLMLMRLTRAAMQRLEGARGRLTTLLRASSALGVAQHESDAVVTAAHAALEIASARAAFVLSDGQGEPKLVAQAGRAAIGLSQALESELYEMATMVLREGLPALRGPAPDGRDPDGSALAVLPLSGDEETRAVLAVLRDGPFDPFQLDSLYMLCGLSSMALRGARTTHEEINRQVLRRARAEEEIHRLAYYDALTGLPNRQFFKERLSHALHQVRRARRMLALLFLDLDRFKEVNDSLGHGAGDKLLRGVAERLVRCVRAVDTVSRPGGKTEHHDVSRLGGDEFTVLLVDLQNVDEAARVAQRILDAMRRPFSVDGHELFVTCSIGIAVHPSDGDDVEALLRGADLAMYHAKDRGKNSFQYFRDSLNTRVMKRITLANRLRGALEREEFRLHYQPQVDLEGRIVGVEALLRWRESASLLHRPDDFLDVAEDAGMAGPIGDWVLRTACRQAAAWRAQGLPPLRMAVNVSAGQFRSGNLVGAVSEALDESRLRPRDLELEITERAMMQDEAEVARALYELKGMGARITLDDFGTGYSPLTYIKRFPVNAVKIDASFIRELPWDPEARAISRAIIQMAHSLDLRVVAEGVETPPQHEFLRNHECDEMQGHLFASPDAPAALAGVLRAGRLRASGDSAE